jgi:hypothetical protein
MSRARWIAAYVASVVGVNIAFSHFPQLDWLWSIAVGSIFVTRDFTQRAIGHWVFAPMAIGLVLSYLLADPFVALAWILLFGGPVAAGVLAARRYCRRPGGSVKLAQARAGQGIVAGVLANLVGALFVTVLGTGTAALTIEVARLRPLVFHAPHASEAAAYGHVLHASQHVQTYVVMCVIFPVIGLMMSCMGMACFMPVPRQSGPQPAELFDETHPATP